MTKTPAFPIETCSLAALPLLIEARAYLFSLAAPKASRLEERIGEALANLIGLAGEVQAYACRWEDGTEFSTLAGKLAEATAEYDDITQGKVS